MLCRICDRGISVYTEEWRERSVPICRDCARHITATDVADALAIHVTKVTQSPLPSDDPVS